MKNKLKALLAVFMGVFAFSAVSLSGVKAAEVTSTFIFDSETELPKVNANSTGTGTAVDEVTGEELKLDIENNMSGSIAWSSGVYFNRKSTDSTEYASFTFTSKGAGSVTLTSFTTQSTSKYANLSLTNSSDVSENKSVAVKEVDQVFTFDSADTYVLKIAGDSTQTSSIKFSSLVITYTYEAASSDQIIVLFDSNGGTSVASQTIAIGSQAEEPSTTKKGYSFDGWYTKDGSSDGEWGSLFDFNSSISESITLYAKWSKNNAEWCTITFNSDGGSEVATTEQIYGTSYELPTSKKEGYAFGGWNDGSNTYTTTYTVPEQASITLTAIWNDLIVFDHYTDFTNGIKNDTVFTISGNIATNKGTCAFNGKEYSTVLKMESSTSITINLPYNSTIYIAFSTSDSKNCKIDGTKVTEITDNYIKTTLNAGEHTITKADTANVGFIGLIYDTISKDVTATFEAQYNAETDADSTKLRFIGTIEGISYDDYANITSVQFTYTFNEVARTGKITSLYKSITNGGAEFKPAADNTLYVVYTLNNINKAAYNGLTLSNLQLVITFSDGSTTTVSHTDIVLPTFNNTIA
ncbi:MAG: InlB B-repeat-containing protein [Anaeroplasma sp.]